MTHHHYRTVFISDIHLGSKDCKAEFLLNFLNNMTCETLYLVGDIVDMWSMSKQFRWPDMHNEIMHKLIALSHQDTRVIFLPGNHDAPLQKYSGMQFGDVEIKRQTIHVSATGKQYLVLHGDQFDGDVTLGKLHSWIGDKGYELLLFLNRWCNRVRAWRNGHYWSLAGYLKQRVKGANEAIERYKHACAMRAKELKLDGVICGHIHHPESDFIEGVHYINDGDWVENCSLVIEDANGEFHLIDWIEYSRNSVVTNISIEKPTGQAA